jgi:hypothetical protein
MPDQDPNIVQPTGGEPQVQVEPAVPQIDPQEYAALKQYYTDTSPFVEKVRPVYDKVTRFVEDEKYRELADQAWESFEHLNKQTEEQVPAWAKSIQENVTKQSEYVAELRNRDAIQAASTQIQNLASQFPVLGENNFSLVNELQAEAKDLGITSLDQFVKYVQRVAPRLAPLAVAAETKEEKKTPPRSLRGDTSLPGTRAPSLPTFDTGRKGIGQRKQYIREQMRKAVGGNS